MTKGECVRIMAVLQAAYPAYYRDLGREGIGSVTALWAELLADYPVDTCALAVKRLIALDTKGYPPVIGQVIASIRDVLHPPEAQLTETEAWALARKAASNGYYHADIEFAKLPPVIRKIVGSPETLHDWSENENIDTVVAASFMRSYRAQAERESSAEALPPGMRAQIASASTSELPEPRQKALDAPKTASTASDDRMSGYGDSEASRAFLAKIRELVTERSKPDDIRDTDAEAHERIERMVWQLKGADT